MLPAGLVQDTPLVAPAGWMKSLAHDVSPFLKALLWPPPHATGVGPV